MFGLSVGGIGVLTAAFSVEIFGSRSLGVIMGTLDVAFSIGSAIGPFVGGLVYDTYSSYTIAFLLAAASNVLVIILLTIIKREPKQERIQGVIY